MDTLDLDVSNKIEVLTNIETSSSYAPSFEEVEEAYWLGPVHLPVCLSVTLAPGQKPLEIGS